MTIWDVLGIEYTENIADIKRAYAYQLKKTRPDENPEDFKTLHAAYKQAIATVKSVVNPETTFHKNISLNPNQKNHTPVRNIENLVIEPNTDRYDIELEAGEATLPLPVNLTEEILSPDNSPDQVHLSDHDHPFEDLDRAWSVLTEKTQAILEDPVASNQTTSWQFLNDSDALYDFNFKIKFSDFLFKHLVRFNRFKENNERLQKAVIEFFNELFRWTDKRPELEQRFGPDAVESILGTHLRLIDKSTTHSTTKSKPSQITYDGYSFIRFMAKGVDMTLAFVIFKLLALFPGHIAVIDYLNSLKLLGNLIGWVPILVIFTIIMEATPLQASLGKRLFGLKVESKKGKRLNILHAVMRQTVMLILVALFINPVTSAGTLAMVLLMNWVVGDGRLIHDKMSFTVVTKR